MAWDLVSDRRKRCRIKAGNVMCAQCSAEPAMARAVMAATCIDTDVPRDMPFDSELGGAQDAQTGRKMMRPC